VRSTVPATDTVDYVATNQAGNTGTSMRIR
jgi:hypothetical protein